MGLAAGVSPGPLLALLVAQTLRYGAREGIKVAIAPMLTDAPIVAASVLLLSQVLAAPAVLGGISILGALYAGWLGIESLRTAPLRAAAPGRGANSVAKAFTVNLLNPHVYLFWGTVGAPMVLRAWADSIAAAAGFVACFYLLLCGSKVILAVLLGRARGLLAGQGYVRTVQGAGVALLVFAVVLMVEGVRQF